MPNYRIIKLFAFSSILVTCHLLFSSPAHAIQAKCDTPDIDYKGPFATLFKGAGASSKDCSVPDPENPDLPVNKEVIDSGRVFCNKGYLEASFHGKDPKNVNPAGKQGKGNVSLNDVSTYAMGGNILANLNSEDNDRLTAFKRAIEAVENYNRSSIYRVAYYEGVRTFDGVEAWAKNKPGLTIDGHLNPSIFGTAQTQTTLEYQVKDIELTVSEIYDCNYVDGYASTHRCSPDYFTKKGEDERASDIAKEIGAILKADNLMETWGNLTGPQQFKAASLHITRSSPTFVVFVPANAMCSGSYLSCAFQWLMQKLSANYTLAEEPVPYYIEAILPESANILGGINEEYNRFNALSENTAPPHASSPAANLSANANNVVIDTQNIAPSTLLASVDGPSAGEGPNGGTEVHVQATGDKMLDALLNRVIKSCPDCGCGTIDKTNNYGSTADATKNKNNIFWTFIQDALSALQAGEKMELYHIYTISPPDIVAANKRISEDKNSMLRKFMPLADTNSNPYTGFETEIYVDQDLSGKSDGETKPSQPHWYGEYETIRNDDGSVTVQKKMIIDYYTYHVGTGEITQPGGNITSYVVKNRIGSNRPLNSYDNFNSNNPTGKSDRCYYEDFIQPLAMSNGFDIAKKTKADQFPQSSCEDPIKPGIAKEILSCTQQQEIPIKAECQLTCDSFNGYTIPPSLKKTIEQAASAFNIPPGLLLGAMYAEGGFEPRCSGSDNSYSDDEIQAMLQCDATSCCNGNAGPFSLISGYAKKAIYQAKTRAGLTVDENNPGNACNIFDSALAIADVISRQRGYNSTLWYNTAMQVWSSLPARQIEGITKADEKIDSCGGIPYTNQSTYSCRGWTDSQAVTAIRLQQGFCGNGNKWMDIHRQQMLDVFHQCSQ